MERDRRCRGVATEDTFTPTPSKDAVEALAQVLWMADPGHTTTWPQAPLPHKRRCCAMSRAALAAIGGREVALEAALHTVKAECDIYISTHHASCMCGACASWRTSDAAIALPRSTAAEAVRHLAACADGGAQTLAQVSLWLRQHPETAAEFERALFPADSLLQICASIARAVRPFGEGDADA